MVFIHAGAVHMVKAKSPDPWIPFMKAKRAGWFQINVDPRVGFGLYSVTVQWDTPLPAGAVSHSIYWQKQAGTLNDAITITYKVGGKTFTAASDLSQDRVLTLSDSGVQVTDGSAGSAHLPTLG